MPEQSNDYHVIVFGAGGVGKTSLILRFIKGTFVELYTPTIEDTYRQVVNCDTNVCTLQITDTSGSHRFPAMQRLSISRGQAFILVYSITSKQSIEELKPLHEQIKQLKGNNITNVPICLVGNKCDEQDRVITQSEGEALANTWRCAFIETSAKNNIQVTQLFETLLKLEKSHKLTLTDDMTSQRGRNKKKGNCLIY